MTKVIQKTSEELHENVPPDWYFQSIKKNIGQRFWHKSRFTQISKLIDKVEGYVLDIGSADGVFSKVVLDKTGAKKLFGIDVLNSSVDWANKHWRNKKMVFKVGRAENLQFNDNYFDAVFALEMLEHVHDPKVVFTEIKRVLKKGGYGLFLVPTDSLLFRIIWFFWLIGRGRIWKSTHLQTYRNNYLPVLCRKAGFEVIVNVKFLLGMLQAIKVKKT